MTKLANGLRVASEAVPDSETATVGVYIDAGSRFETDATNGAAHFLEHMAFKGTDSRGVRDLEVEIENLGGHLNAYTSREQTAYYAKVFKRDVPQAVAILADILQNSRLDDRAIERERDVILREQEEIEGIPEEVVFDHLHATAFQYSPLGRTILGSAANIRSLTRDDLAAYIAANYVAPRMVVAAAGAVDHEALVAAVEKGFGGLPSEGPTAAQLVAAAPAKYTGSEVRIRDPEQPALHVALAFKGASWADPDAVPLMVIQTLLGSWEKNSGAGADGASPLVQPIAVNGLANSFMAFNTNYHDTGLFGVYAVAEPDADHEDLCWTILNRMTAMSYGISETEVLRAKNQLKASILFSGDGTTGAAFCVCGMGAAGTRKGGSCGGNRVGMAPDVWADRGSCTRGVPACRTWPSPLPARLRSTAMHVVCRSTRTPVGPTSSNPPPPSPMAAAGMAEDIGRNLLVYGRRIPRAELFARIDAVDAETVKAVAYRFFNDQSLTAAMMGDTQNVPDYNWLSRRTYWLRF